MTGPDHQCRAMVRRDGQPEPCPEPTGRPLCDTHLAGAARDVPLLVHDWRDLEQLLPRSIGEWSDGLPRGGGEAPIPLRLDVEALQARIWWLATCWAEVLTGLHRLADPPVRVRQGFAVQWAVGVLAPRVDVLVMVGPVEMVSYPGADPDLAVRHGAVELSYVDGARGLLDLAWAHQLARSVLGLTEPVYVLPGRCQVKGCGAQELRVKDGSDSVWCDRCGAAMTRDDYDRLGNVFLRGAA